MCEYVCIKKEEVDTEIYANCVHLEFLICICTQCCPFMLQLLITYKSHFRGKGNMATSCPVRSGFLSCQDFKEHRSSKAHHSHHANMGKACPM